MFTHKVKIKDTVVLLQQADITEVVVDAIVSPDSNDFFMSRGPARAISKASGIKIREQIKFDRPVKIGDAIITEAGSLPAKNIIHLAYMGTDDREFSHGKISSAINNALALADQKKLSSVAFPVFTFSVEILPYKLCAKIMLSSIFGYFMSQDSQINLAVVAVYDQQAFEDFDKVFKVIKESYML